MTAMQKQAGRTATRIGAAGIALTFALGLVATPAVSAERLQVTVDQAKIAKLPQRVATIVIGNPLIADISVQPNGMMVVTGKGYGVTNVVMLDKSGNVLAEKTVQVRPPRDGVVVVYRGTEKESYSCMPNCERRITLGDSSKFFDATVTQTQSLTGAAQRGGTPEPAPSPVMVVVGSGAPGSVSNSR